MQKCFMVYRVLTFQTGETQALPLCAFEDKQESIRNSHARQAALSEILTTGKVRVRAAGESPDTIELRDLIHDIGITGVAHTVSEVDIKAASMIVVPKIHMPETRH